MSALAPGHRKALEQLGQGLLALDARAKKNPHEAVQWLPMQDRYLRSQSRFRCLRAGNQIGKTWVALSDLIWQATGTHPYREYGREKAGEYIIVTASWSQCVAIQKKLWELLPQHRVHPDTVFTSSRGFRGKNPSVELRHESGEWSIIRFKTGKQGGLDLAGSTVDSVLFDEPPLINVYSELSKRVVATGGTLSISMTPINAPVHWLQEIVEAPDSPWDNIHTRLTPEAMIPVGHTRPRVLPDGTVCDARWIEHLVDTTLSSEVPVRVHGEWECRAVHRTFMAFDQAKHVHTRVPRVDCRVVLGIDHGTRWAGRGESKQIAILGLVDESAWANGGTGHSKVYFLDEHSPQEMSTPAMDAKGILAMLRRHGLTWEDVDFAGGDKVHMKGTASQKSNRDLMVAIGRELNKDHRLLRTEIFTVKRGKHSGSGSRRITTTHLHAQMVMQDGFGVHPRCKRLIDAIQKYDERDNEYKDPVDAARYALWEYSPKGRGQAHNRKPAKLKLW